MIFDGHLHAMNVTRDGDALLASMREAGIDGGCVFSNCPPEYNPKTGTSFEERLDEIMTWTKGHRDRLFPVLWIHPYEENVEEKIDRAVAAGVDAFKIICGNFYVYEERSLAAIRRIASHNKPIFFHSGILWSDHPTVPFNRPSNWEALLPIEGLRFSMGQCSWPWIDECIAMYGEFEFAHRNGKAAEMFFDTTPGTPALYREELLTKLYKIGYNVGQNVFFGTDSAAHAYDPAYAAEWLATDRRILDKLGISRDDRDNMYYRNLLRFLGKDADSLSACASGPKRTEPITETVRRWYRALSFPSVYDAAFDKALKTVPISDAVTVDTYDFDEPDGKRNLLSFLWFCEDLKDRYAKKGIPDDILMATLSDVVRWTNVWTDRKGERYLGELAWLRRSFTMRLFRIGCLQFAMAEAGLDCPEKGIARGDRVIEIHIPAGVTLTVENCRDAVCRARAFFASFYPEYAAAPILCCSWLLDPSLRELLPPDSRILSFQALFDLIGTKETDSILKFVFRHDTTRFNVRNAVACSAFAERVKRRALEGGRFYAGTGLWKKL